MLELEKFYVDGPDQTRDEAEQFDTEMVDMLNKLGIEYTYVDGDETSVDVILKDLGV